MVMAERSKDIGQFTFMRSCMIHPIRSQQWKIHRARNFNCNAVALLFVTMKMALEFDVNVFGAEDLYQLLNSLQCRLWTIFSQRRCQGAFIAAGQTDNALHMFLQVLGLSECTLFSSRTQLHLRNEPAEILISDA